MSNRQYLYDLFRPRRRKIAVREFRNLILQVKFCSGCDEFKAFDNYHKHKNGKYGLRAKCIPCRNQIKRDSGSNRKYWNKNKDSKNKKRREKYHNDKDYREKVKERKYKYVSDRLENDPEFRLIRNLRRRVLHALSGNLKTEKTIELLGCERDELINWLERQFDDSMSWNNYGKVWHTDHEIPCAKFDLTDPYQQAVCFHYSNLQPMSKERNYKKNDQIQMSYEENDSKHTRDIGYYVNYGFCNS